MSDLPHMLRDFDQTAATIKAIGDDRGAFDALMIGLEDERPHLRARVAAVADQATRDRPEWLQPHKDLILSVLFGPESHDAVLWSLAHTVGRLELTREEAERAVPRLHSWFQTAKSRALRVGSLQSVVQIAKRYPEYQELAQLTLSEALGDPIPSLSARARRLLKELAEGTR